MGEDSLNITLLTINKDSSLIAYMHNRIHGRSINEIVDPKILIEEGGACIEQQLQAVLNLGSTCIEEDPQSLPTMVYVTKELRWIEKFIP
jgi:hypothetical protein